MTPPEFATPDEAERAFYDAFEASDLNAMMNVWADRDFIECIHPMSDRTKGRPEVEASWRQIFDGGMRVRLQCSNIHRTQDALLAVHVLYEHFSAPGEDVQHPPIIATNIYQLIEGSWRMVLHHASPSPQDEFEQQWETPGIPASNRQLH
jgi:ketosteroid isomerase-like protein